TIPSSVRWMCSGDVPGAGSGCLGGVEGRGGGVMEDRSCGSMCGGCRPQGGGGAGRVEGAGETGRVSAAEGARLTEVLGAGVREVGAAGEVRGRVVGDAVMAGLHERHSGVVGTTDVLTFDLRPMGLGPLDVDLVVCVDEAERQAGSRGHE